MVVSFGCSGEGLLSEDLRGGLLGEELRIG